MRNILNSTHIGSFSSNQYTCMATYQNYKQYNTKTMIRYISTDDTCAHAAMINKSTSCFRNKLYLIDSSGKNSWQAHNYILHITKPIYNFRE